ncbi:MAG TPA: FAD-binding oxidoreductase [Burkholderiaceae bacterium]|nr:FAD-binding oxidoreductase [Burkholderiaceae bacterium]
MRASDHLLNDVHSQLNPTRVARVERPLTLAELQALVVSARAKKQYISTAGGRHAMGGQQFAADTLHVDTTQMEKVLVSDGERGLLTMEAGAMWPAIIAATHVMPSEGRPAWAIRQKQTGVDAVTLGGSIAANAHGRGLAMQPLSDDIEELTLVDALGNVVVCNRSKNAELFSLVIGGYGLFGIVYSATLRLTPRVLLQREVDIIDLDDAMNAVFRRVDEGCLYGDFQFVIDATDDRFLRRGVLACYKPASIQTPPSDTTADLDPKEWLQLLRLAHQDKRAAFRLYASHYLNTDGNCYWSDTMQLSTYIPSYAEALAEPLDNTSEGAPRETLVIGEYYVPRESLPLFMQRAGNILRAFGTEVIYGTIRSILCDTTSFLPWAKADFACVIFNLRTPHNDAGLLRTADTFRALIDVSIELRGSFFLTYHRAASPSQVAACYPNFRQWLAKKKLHDPSERFTSTWYMHYRDAFASESPR